MSTLAERKARSGHQSEHAIDWFIVDTGDKCVISLGDNDIALTFALIVFDGDQSFTVADPYRLGVYPHPVAAIQKLTGKWDNVPYLAKHPNSKGAGSWQKTDEGNGFIYWRFIRTTQGEIGRDLAQSAMGKRSLRRNEREN